MGHRAELPQLMEMKKWTQKKLKQLSWSDAVNEQHTLNTRRKAKFSDEIAFSSFQNTIMHSYADDLHAGVSM